MERRRRQILDAARECFVKEGFQAASMQDIFRASGLSAGAVYRYFPSKHLLVKAIAEDALNASLARLSLAGDAALDSADIVTVFAGTFAAAGELAEFRPIILQVWAEVSRDPEMAAVARDLLSQIIGRISRALPPGTPPEVPRLMMATIQGFLVQSVVMDDVTPELVAAAARAAFR